MTVPAGADLLGFRAALRSVQILARIPHYVIGLTHIVGILPERPKK
jgi:hypothetical protein